MKKTNIIMLALIFLGGVSLEAQTAILEYKFNDSGTTTSSTGSTTNSGTFLNSSGVATDLHSAAGLGVSGAAGDLAFDNTASIRMGGSDSTNAGGRMSSGSPSSVQNFTSFTLQGWYKTDVSEVIGSGARLFNMNTGTAGFFLVGNGTSGNLALGVNGTSAGTTSNSYSATSTWTFFAVTYDGTITSNNVKFYIGDSSSSVTLVQTLTLNKGTVGDASAVPFVIGSDNSTTRPMDGYMDNMRVFGTTSGTSGVLSLSDLESLRVVDITAVPEPSTYALLFMGGAGLWLTKRMRSQRSK